VLGGGSNLLISDDGFDGLVLKVENKGIEILSQDESSVTLKVASGEVWDEFVKFVVKNNWWGVENLSHIPGSTGAIAVQNVGAYGQEAKNVIDSVVVFNRETHEIQSLKSADCGFAYRSSIFNTSQKGKYIIFNIVFKLSKIPQPILSYRDLQIKFEGQNPSLDEIRNAVIVIRDKKFPFPTGAKKGNAGSFFKNPLLDDSKYSDLVATILKTFGNEKAEELGKKKFEDQDQIKVPAAFLIELCGLKDLENGGAAINQNQPLVIINKSGTATAAEVLALANRVRSEVLAKTGIELAFEPELIGF
jgi:UDP-N-acetylmuramate dehydrogenase